MTILAPFICGIPLGTAQVLIALVGFAAFLGSTWEEWHTGVLYLGIVSGPTEGAWSLCLVSLISGIYGSTDFWTRPREIPFIGSSSISSFPLYNVVLYTFILGGLSTIRTSCLHVSRKSGPRALFHLLGPLFYLSQCWLLTRLVPSILSSQSDFYWFVFFAGWPICFRVSMTIVAYVTRSPLPRPSVLEAFPVVLNVLACCGYKNVLSLMKWLAVLSLLVYAVAIHLVVGDMCRYLDIFCLTIKRRK